jgi:DNA polymerase IV
LNSVKAASEAPAATFMVAELQPLIDKVWRHCESTGSRGRTVTLKVKFSDFEIITRSRSVSSAVANRDDLARLSIGLLERLAPSEGCAPPGCVVVLAAG